MLMYLNLVRGESGRMGVWAWLGTGCMQQPHFITCIIPPRDPRWSASVHLLLLPCNPHLFPTPLLVSYLFVCIVWAMKAPN